MSLQHPMTTRMKDHARPEVRPPAVEPENRELVESRLLCSAMLAFAVGWLAWSMPLPSAQDVLFSLLCLSLVAIEQRRVRAQRTREVP